LPAQIRLQPSAKVELIGNRITGPCGSACIHNQGTAQIIGNTIEGSGVGLLDDGTAVIMGNRMVDMTINSSTSTIFGNEVSGTLIGSGGRVITSGAMHFESSSSDFTIVAGGSAVAVGSSGDVTVSAASDFAVVAGGSTVLMKATGTISITAADSVTIESNAVTRIWATDLVEIDVAANVQIDAGADVEIRAQSGDITMSGSNVYLSADNVLQLNAPTIDINGSSQVDVDGGLITLN
jgi:hypothetical protein